MENCARKSTQNTIHVYKTQNSALSALNHKHKSKMTYNIKALHYTLQQHATNYLSVQYKHGINRLQALQCMGWGKLKQHGERKRAQRSIRQKKY